MKVWRRAVLLAFVAAGLALASPAGRVLGSGTLNVASDSYYRLDPASGTLTVRVEATVQNATGSPLATVPLWAMPKFQNLVLKEGDTALQTKTVELPDIIGSVNLVGGTLPAPMKNGGRADFVMTYDVPAQTNRVMTLEPGSIEFPILGQGAGSFVWVDVPTTAENYFDPGCLRAADQPGSVRDAGMERWVCGDATLIALSTDDPSVQRQCANADDKCRQRVTPSPYSAFVQSISDPSLRGTKEADLTLADHSVRVSLRYFRRDEKWADEQFATAVAALPKLQEVFGFPYTHDTILMRESHHIELIGAAGVAFPEQGEVLLATDTGFDREVTVHELAHQWAGENLASNWLWEGLAEYGMRVVAPELGITPIDRRWQSFGYQDALATWYNGSEVYNPNYWYGKAGAFWFAYEQAVGGRANMEKVLARMAQDPKRLPLDGRWFMDEGEYASGANLDSLFLTWVFNAKSATATIAERRAAHELLQTLNGRIAQFGFAGFPADVQANLDAWTFAGVEAQVKQVAGLLDAYEALLAQATAAGLGTPDQVAQAWRRQSIAQLTSLIENQRQAVAAITGTANALAAEPESSPALPKLAEARDRYNAGDFSEAKRLAGLAITVAADKTTAARMIEVANEKKAAFKPNLLTRFGLAFEDPDSDLAKAQAAYDAGDPSRALKLSKSAYDGWNEAAARGMQRLAALSGLMAFLCVGVWWLLQRMDVVGSGRKLKTSGRASGGHYLSSPARPRDRR